MGITNEKYMYLFAFVIVLIASFLVRGCSADRTPIETPETLIAVQYTPMQCETMPWDDWLANSSIRFIRAPSEQEVMNMYYNNEYNITLKDIRIVKTTEAVCETCGVCKLGYTITTSVKLKDIRPMLDTGWERLLKL